MKKWHLTKSRQLLTSLSTRTSTSRSQLHQKWTNRMMFSSTTSSLHKLTIKSLLLNSMLKSQQLLNKSMSKFKMKTRFSRRLHLKSTNQLRSHYKHMKRLM
jgi:hypothetical protein